MIIKFKNFITYLRNKPENTKKVILYIAVAICAVAVFGLWTLSWKTQLAHPAEKKNTELKKEQSLLKDLWRSLKSTVNPYFEAKNILPKDITEK